MTRSMRQLLALAATAAGVAIGPTAARADLLFWNQGDASVRAFSEQVVKTYEAAHPGKHVTLQIYPNEPYKTAIQVAMGADRQPDVFFNWNGENSARFVRDGRILDLSAVAARWGGAVPPALMQSYAVGGKPYGVPITEQTAYFYYSKAFFADHGLQPPHSLAELQTMCGHIRQADPQAVPIALGAKEPWTIIHYLSLLFAREVPKATRDADYAMRGDAAALFTDPGYQKALADLDGLRQARCFNDGVSAVSPEESRSMFAAGLAVTTFCGTWCVAPIRQEGFDGQYGIFPMPAVEGGRGEQGAVFAVVTGLQIAASSKTPDDAADLIATYLSAPVQAAMYRTIGRIPVNPAADAAGMDPVSAQASHDLAGAPSLVNPLDVELESSVSVVLLSGGQRLMNGTETPADLMTEVRAKAVAAKARLGR